MEGDGGDGCLEDGERLLTERAERPQTVSKPHELGETTAVDHVQLLADERAICGSDDV